MWYTRLANEERSMTTHSIDAYPEKNCAVFVTATGKTTWEASGEFRGEPLSVKARSEVGALRLWRELAEARYRSS